MTRHFALRQLAPLALAASALLSCSSSKTPTGGDGSEFTLEIVWLGTQPSGPTLASFDAALNIVRATVVGGLSTVSIPATFTSLSQCGLTGHPEVSRENIRGLRVYLLVEAIDGAAGTLGQAGPCLVRANDIPALGFMRFDEADVANLQASGRLPRVVLHELMHVLGFGTVWYDTLVDTVTTPTDVRYIGATARTACVTDHAGTLPCASTIPIHSADGPGSRFSHWRESTFQSELMTPFLGAGSTPFSTMSIQVLTDIGYEVSATSADPYTVPTPPAAAMLRHGPASSSDVVLPEPVLPRWRIGVGNRLEPYRPRR